MVRGSCLCGGVKFEVERAVGPFELCHCTRCRKVSGSTYLTWLGVRREDFRFLQGVDLIKTFELPVSESPPPYDTSFCSRCGSQVPNPSRTADPMFEIPAGALDDDPRIRPDKHIYVEFRAPWDAIKDDLPQLTKQDIRATRTVAASPSSVSDATRLGQEEK
jgi:hypothetical protein